MKRKSLLLVVIMVLSLSLPVFASKWADGTYEAWSDAGARSYQYAKVVIQDGKIAGVILKEFTGVDVEKNWSEYNWDAVKQAIYGFNDKFVAAQSAEVDIVTDATGSSNGWIKAVERALLKAEIAADPSKKTSTYFDGTFLGRSNHASRGYYEVVWVTIKNDKITAIKFDRIQPDHTSLDLNDYAWPLGAARDAYADAVIEKGTAPVDIMSGATGAFTMWNIAVMDALDKARI